MVKAPGLSAAPIRMPRFALLVLCLGAASALGTDTDVSSESVLVPYDFLFDAAVEAYSRSEWLSVILNMEKALRNKATLRRVRAQCRLRCANQTAFGEPVAGLGVPVPGADSVHDLGFFQKILQRAHCVSDCEELRLGAASRHHVSEEVELEFQKRSPYNYLQVAYFKINKLDKAVAAAHTFFLANPDHTEMKQNLDYYKLMAGVHEDHFRDLEARPHMAEFLLGKRFYSDDSFQLAAQHFETALDEYFTADKECRVLCEGTHRFDGYSFMEYSADLFQAMTDHYMQVLNCKQRCSVDLASAAGKEQPYEDFLPSHFNYLQFSYYNSEKYEEAVECAKTFLLFHPEDKVMIQNLNYYSAVLGGDRAQLITARQVVQQYMQQSILEKELLYFGYEAFGITFVDPDTWTPEDVMPKKLRDKQKADKETAARITEEIGNLMKEIETLVEEKKKDSSDMAKMVVPQEGGALLYEDIRVTLTSKELNGSQRVLLDGVIGDDDCRELQRLSNAAALKGDGYRGQPSPHTPSETFQGVTVLKAVKLGQEGKVPLKSARLFLDLSEKVRTVLESYFHLDTRLYFSYSHLVCRSAIHDKQEGRGDLSHPVHVDNCVLIPELRQCVKEPPAYTHRDYSAILYLNNDFEGGEFIFTELDAETVTAQINPRCGRVVGFGAGQENPHGVRAITRGQRCAVALWFTLDPAHEEKERIQAQDMLNMFATPVHAEFSRQKESDASGTDAQSDQAAKLDETPSTAKNTGESMKAPDSTKGATETETKATAQLEAKATAQPEAKATAQPEAKATVQPEAKATAQPEAKATVQPEAKATAQPEAKATAQPEAKATAQPEAKATAQPEAKATAQPEAKATAQPEAKATAQPEAKATAQPEAKATAQPEAKATVQPEAKATAQPEAKATAQPEAKAMAQPEAKATAQPEAKATAQPEAKAMAQPEAKATAQPKANAKATAQSKAKAKATAQSKPKAKAKAKAQPEAKATAKIQPEATAQAAANTDAKQRDETPAAETRTLKLSSQKDSTAPAGSRDEL